MLNIILVGPQGSGKGTQAKLICEKYNVPHISTGDLFRGAIKNKTELGKIAEKRIKNGELVPDVVTVGLVKERISKEDCKTGYLLDGFPRTLEQARALDEITEVTHVIEITAPDELSIKRISSRRICSKCAAIYGIDVVPKKEGVCDACGGKLIQRDDDTPEAVKKRLATYHDVTEPLLEYYRPRDIVFSVDGSKPINDVFEAIKKVLDEQE